MSLLLSEEDRVVYLLASFPESFSALVTALEAYKNVPKKEIQIEKTCTDFTEQRAFVQK